MDRNMDNLELISDDDLRLRLQHYGLPNVPVTSSTRKVLISKLRKSMANEKTKLRRDTTQATSYSSGEDSEHDARKPVRANKSLHSNEGKNFKFQVPAPKPIPTTPTYDHHHPSPPRRRTNNIHISRESTEDSLERNRRSNSYISPLITSETEEEDSDFNNSSVSQLRNRSNISNKSGNSQTFSQNSNGHNNKLNEDLPYLSDFTKRLLKLRENRVPAPQSSTSLPPAYRTGRIFQDREIVHHAYPTTTTTTLSQPKYTGNNFHQPRNSTKMWIKNLFIKFDQNYYNGIKHSIIPCSLVSGLIIFFTVVIFMYLTISPNILSSLNENDTNFAICRISSQSSVPGRNCIESTAKLESVLSILRIVVPELQRRAIETMCGQTYDTSNVQKIAMSSNDIVNFVMEQKPEEPVHHILNDLKQIGYLVSVNPQWSITNGGDDNNQQLSDNLSQLSLSILNPKLPFSCLLRNKFKNFFFVVGILAIISFICFAVRFIITYYVNAQRLKKDQFNGIVNEIVQCAAQMSPTDQAIVLNHLRDKIIPPEKRREMSKMWNEAIKFLELNDSRIQFDITTINGEDCKTIKWVDTLSRLSSVAKSGVPNTSPNRGGGAGNSLSSTSSSSTVKKWQSPAFDKTNKIADPPTPCLKIRQMFDRYEANYPNLKTVIQDSILEKVGSNCMIYDIQLDTSTCCVYVRCATARDAGIVHDEINGWWFDNRLVSIKFVRLERYLNRFPKSLSGPNCLKPSNSNKSSMSQCDVANNNNIDDDTEIGGGGSDDGNGYD